MLTVKPISDNPLYPLPGDYHSLTRQGRSNGQRAARVNACRQWMLPHLDDAQRGTVFNQCVVFFDHTYLRATEHYEPGFYDMPPCEDAPFFGHARSAFGTYKANLIIFPRGYAKSTLSEQCTLLRTIACPMFSTLYATNIHLNAKKRGTRLRYQCFHNVLIEKDWGPEYGGLLKPARGEQSTGVDHFVLTNGSEILTRSVGSEVRGLRVRRAVVDDVEADEAVSTSMTTRREEVDRFINTIVVPMILRPGCGVDWLATFISKQHFAWKAMQVQMVGGREVAKDLRFQNWNRMFMPAAVSSEDGLISSWPDLYPATDAEVESNPNLKGRTSLETTRRIMGDRRFFAEYMGRPADGGAKFFPELTPERHGWWLEHSDEEASTSPRDSKALFCYSHGGTVIKEPLPRFLNSVRLFMHCDYAYTHHNNSDFKAVGLFAFLKGPGLRFCLDLWAAQCVPNKFTRAILLMADRWKCPLVYVEAIKEGMTLYDDLRSVISTRVAKTFGVTFFPKIAKQPSTMAAKTDRIAALEPLLDNDLFKFPLSKANQGAWPMLFQQIDEFSPEARDGGLQNDDCLDLCAMTRDVVAGHLPRSKDEEQPAPDDPFAQIQKGNLTAPDGTPYAFGLDLSKIPPSKIQELLNARDAARPRRHSRA
jgi:hypothetical protein